MKPRPVTFMGGPLDGATWTVSVRVVQTTTTSVQDNPDGAVPVDVHTYWVDSDGRTATYQGVALV